MSNSGKIAPRNFPNYFLHPSYHEQPTRETFDATPKRRMEILESIAKGHLESIVYLTQLPAERTFIVEVVLEKGRFFIESPCTFTPSLGIDALDGNLIHDAEEWILMQQLNMKPRRLTRTFGNNDRRPYEDYIKIITAPHAGRNFQDVPVEFEENIEKWTQKTTSPTTISTDSEAKEIKKPWWKFW
jgi:hypothetical protein